ncbi:MAG: acetate kinase [Prevotellaceae bacterium]|jgi:acetate kinase|nr:acetate kinase [Prevotellaceae bacterium]
MVILVLNCGSSSIKYQLLKMSKTDTPSVLAKGIVERIGQPEGCIEHRPGGKDKVVLGLTVSNHTVGINKVLELLVSNECGVIGSLEEITAVGHRVAHGGEYFTASSLVTDAVKLGIEQCIELAPLHNPANLKGITAMEELLPSVPQVACFDTSFHQTMPEHAYFYGIPYKYYQKYKIRRYGFHGTSHKFVAQKACNALGLDFNTAKIITCHMGNGSSITAINRGKSVDTSMGFTPVEGLMMGTRCGDLDAGVITFLEEKEGLTSKAINNLLNKESGLSGVSGVSSDMRDLWKAADEGNKLAKLAIDIFCYRVLKYIGAYAAAMNGVDLVVFTGGIGENDHGVRELVSRSLGYLGAEYDHQANDKVRGVDFKEISTPTSKVKLVIAATNEELVIATDTMNIVSDINS